MNPTPSDLPASPTPGSSLRDQIKKALDDNPWAMSQEASDVLADAVMAVVQPAVDREWRRALEATIKLDMVRELVQMPHNASDHLSSRVLSVLDMPVPEET